MAYHLGIFAGPQKAPVSVSDLVPCLRPEEMQMKVAIGNIVSVRSVVDSPKTKQVSLELGNIRPAADLFMPVPAADYDLLTYAAITRF